MGQNARRKKVSQIIFLVVETFMVMNMKYGNIFFCDPVTTAPLKSMKLQDQLMVLIEMKGRASGLARKSQGAILNSLNGHQFHQSHTHQRKLHIDRIRRERKIDNQLVTEVNSED